MKKVLVTGGQGFLGSFLCQELLASGYHVTSVDNYSKYGRTTRPQDNHPNFSLVEMDLTKDQLCDWFPAGEFDYIVAMAARIGGIAYFSTNPYTIMRDNELIAANTFDYALRCHKSGHFNRIVVVSSSMVFEGCDYFDSMINHDWWKETGEPYLPVWPTREEMLDFLPIPNSVYGFQKLAMEFWAKAAREQHGLPFTIVRPFNAVGVGELPSKEDHEIMSGDIKMALSHVLPDICLKVLKGQDPLRIFRDGKQTRHYTHGADLARGIRLALESDYALNNDFNLSTPKAHTVLELAEMVWKEVHGDSKPFRVEFDEPFRDDVQIRSPDVTKAASLLKFEAQIPLEQSIAEVLDWIKKEHVV